MSFGKDYNLTVEEYTARNITKNLNLAGVDTRKISAEFPKFLSDGNNLSAMFAGLKTMFKNFAKGFIANLKAKIAGKIGQMAGKLLEGPIKAVKGVLGNIADAAQMAKSQIGDAVSNLVGENSGLKQMFSFLPDSVQTGIMNAAGSFGSVFDVVGAGTKAIGGVLDNIASGKYILNPGSFKQDVKNIGAFVTAGFENGINNALSHVVNGIANPSVIMGVAGKVLDSVVDSKDFNRFMDVAGNVTNGAVKFVTSDLPNLATDIAGSLVKPDGKLGDTLSTFGNNFTKSMDAVFPNWNRSATDGILSSSTLAGASPDVKDGMYAGMMDNVPNQSNASSLDSVPSDDKTFVTSTISEPRSSGSGSSSGKYEYGYAEDGTVNKIYVVENGTRRLDWSEGDTPVVPQTTTTAAVESRYTPPTAVSTYTPPKDTGISYGAVEPSTSTFQRGQPGRPSEPLAQDLFPELYKK